MQTTEERWEAVVRTAESIIGIAPNHKAALRFLAEGYHMLGNSTAATGVLDRLSRLCPDDPSIAWNLLVAEFADKNFEKVISHIEVFRNNFGGYKQAELRRLMHYSLSMRAGGQKSVTTRSKTRVADSSVRPAGRETERAAEVLPPPVKDAEPTIELPREVPKINIDISMDNSLCRKPPAVGDNAIDWLRQRLRYAHLQMQNEFEELVCIGSLTGVHHFTYQAETVRRVLKTFRGRVLLCDEVGLGKTIEAAMVIKEYLLRGMAKTVLVLCPPSLVHQWNAELRNKFGIHGHAQNNMSSSGKGPALWAHDIVIASIHTAKGRAGRAAVLEKPWDLVVVDEAHHLRNRRTLAWSLVNSIRKKFILLLTATPVQNDLGELYNLITLLKPGAFPPEKEFLRTYSDPKNARVPRNTDTLRLLMRDCMIRNTRASCGVPFPKRFATTHVLNFNDDEAWAYGEICKIANKLAAEESPRLRLLLRMLLERAGAHVPLALRALRNLAAFLRGSRSTDPEREQLAGRIEELSVKIANMQGTTGKITALVKILRASGSPVIVFCRHSATVQYVCGELLSAGVPYAAFHGGLSGGERLAAMESFRAGEVHALVSSESGGEGHNLQFCNALVNFDLPWNPMQIEQRIGRIHRIGQARDVFVFNLCYAGTLEEKILGILETKIRMFELVIGEVDSILGNLDERGGFGEVVMDLWVKSGEEGARSRAFEELGEFLVKSRESYLEACRFDEALFGREMEA
jgi:superfamily II DNA or RNA helicase